MKLPDLIDPKHPDAKLLEYLAYDQDKVEKLLEDPHPAAHPHRPQRQAGHGGLPAGGVEDLGLRVRVFLRTDGAVPSCKTRTFVL